MSLSCGIESQINAKGDIKDFPFYFNKTKQEKYVFYSELKGKGIPAFSIYKNVNNDIDTILSVGIYKVTFIINEKQEPKHFTNISKGILYENEIKDIHFYKIDIVPLENGKAIVTTIFEIITNPLPLLYIIYCLGGIGVALASGFTIKKVNKLITSISGNIIKIGASLIAILIGIKVIAKW